MTSKMFYDTSTHLDLFNRLFESVAFGTGRILYGINIDCRPEASRIMLKTFTDDRAEICYLNASTLERCCELVEALCHSGADIGVKWHEDGYYKPTVYDS